MPDMGQQNTRISDVKRSDLGETRAIAQTEAARSSAEPERAPNDTSISIARQLNGPLTALLLYIGELKKHSHQFAQSAQDRDYLQKVVDRALEQTERVCDLVKQLGGTNRQPTAPRAPVMPASDGGQRRLTRREREVLNLISEGNSNKEGALRMQISPRTFESHRAEVMRKLGARNTADLVRAALLHPLQ